MNPKVQTMVDRAWSDECRREARELASSFLPEFPTNGCAAFLSSLMEQSGIDVGAEVNAQALADELISRGWEVVATNAPGAPDAGDVGVTLDQNENGMADHIYLCIQAITNDEMTIVDNQSEDPSIRYLSGQGKTPTDYLLRAP